MEGVSSFSSLDAVAGLTNGIALLSSHAVDLSLFANSLSLQEHLAAAEANGRSNPSTGAEKDLAQAVKHYDAARWLAQQSGDADQEDMIMVGKGYALVTCGDKEHRALGIECLDFAKQRAKTEQQRAFLEQLLEQHPCEVHESSVCQSDNVLDLSLEDQALVDLIAREGLSKSSWDEKAKVLSQQLADGLVRSGKSLAKRWSSLADVLKVKLSTNPGMPCGHTCGTCPTRSSCQLHEAVETEGNTENDNDNVATTKNNTVGVEESLSEQLVLSSDSKNSISSNNNSNLPSVIAEIADMEELCTVKT